MATKVKPSRINISGVPQVGQVPMYVDADNFQWGNAGSSGYGRFLSLWNATTGQPISFPEATPYTYVTGDYFMVEVVSTATPPVNYRPDGASYTGTASSVTESDELEVGDVYVYDGTVWLLQSNHGKTVTFANIAGDPYDNINLGNALGDKQDVLTAGANITIDPLTNEISASNTTYSSATTTTAGIVKLGSDTAISEAIQSPAGATNKTYPVQLNASGQMGVNVPRANTTYGAGTGISIDANNDIQNTGVTSVNSSTGAVTVNDIKVAAAAPASPTEGMTWYDTANDKLKSYDGANWNVVGDGDVTGPASSTDGHLAVFDGATGKLIKDGGAVPEQNVKVFTLSSASDLVTAQAAYDWYAGGGVPIITINGYMSVCKGVLNNVLRFFAGRGYGAASNGAWSDIETVELNISSSTVTSITFITNRINISSSAPTSGNNSTITLVI